MPIDESGKPDGRGGVLRLPSQDSLRQSSELSQDFPVARGYFVTKGERGGQNMAVVRQVHQQDVQSRGWTRSFPAAAPVYFSLSPRSRPARVARARSGRAPREER